MALAGPPSVSEECDQLKPGDIEIVSNWRIINEKLFHNTISTVDVTRSPGRADLEDVVSLETCIRLEGDANERREPCNITIKLKNGRRIARIAIVSEAFLIEIYKQFGEYVSTAHPEFIDEFEQSAVYFADVCLTPPTPEVSIKFARLKNPGEPMWLYGIRLSLTEPVPKKEGEHEFDYNVIGNLMQSKSESAAKPGDWATKLLKRSDGDQEDCPSHDLDSFLRDFMSLNMGSPKNVHILSRDECRKSKENAKCIGDTKDIRESDLKTYIDCRLREMEERLMKKIDDVNCKTNEKLDEIIKLVMLCSPRK